MLTDKPNSVVITVRDRTKNKSKSLTVYETTVEDVYKRIEKVLKTR